MKLDGPMSGSVPPAEPAAHEMGSDPLPPPASRVPGGNGEDLAALERKYAIKLADARQAAFRLSAAAAERERALAAKLHDAQQVALQMSRAANERMQRLAETLRSSRDEALQLSRMLAGREQEFSVRLQELHQALAARERKLDGLRAKLASSTELLDEVRRALNNATRSLLAADGAVRETFAGPDAVGITRLLALQGPQFVVHAYRLLLHREPDPEGFSHYMDELASGVSTVEIARRLRYSAEGREVGADVRGIRVRLVAAFLYRVPVAGRLLEAIAEIAGSFVAVREPRAFGHDVVHTLERERLANRSARERLLEIERRIARFEANMLPRPPGDDGPG